MIKTFEEFNNDILCESNELKRPKVIKDLIIYSEYDGDDCVCKTWEDVLKLFSNPKYNIKCAIPYTRIEKEYSYGLKNNSYCRVHRDVEKTYWKRYDSVLHALEDIDNIWAIYIFNGVISIEYKKENSRLYILNNLGKNAKERTDLSQSSYHAKIRMDLLDWYNDPTNFDEDIKDEKNDNIIKNLVLYDDYPNSDNKPNRTWEEVIQILSNPKYNVKCAVLRLEKGSYGKYKYIYDYKEYRYNNDDVYEEDSIVEEIERILNLDKKSYKNKKYKRISICDGAIIYTAQIKNNSNYTFLIAPLNDQGKKIKKFENEEDIFDPKYRIMIEQDIFDDIETTTNKYIQRIKTLSSFEDIDIVMKNAFKTLTQEQHSIILAHSLCRELELGIWEPTDIDSKEIIKAIEERFGITYTENK